MHKFDLCRVVFQSNIFFAIRQKVTHYFRCKSVESFEDVLLFNIQGFFSGLVEKLCLYLV